MEHNKVTTMYPCLLDLSQHHVTVFGGGEVAQRRVLALLDARATVEVIAPSLTETLQIKHRRGLIVWQQRMAHDEDVVGSHLIFIATSDHQRNADLHQLALTRGCLVNNASDPERSTLWVPSVIRRGPVTIALNTSVPTLTRVLKQVVERAVTAQWGVLAGEFDQLRVWAKSNLPTTALRRQFWQHIASALPDGLSWSTMQWRAHISNWLESSAPGVTLPPIQ